MPPTLLLNPFASLALFMSLALFAAVPLPAGADPAASVLTRDMARFVAILDDVQAEKACYVFDDAERFDLRLAPLGLEGLRIEDMTEAQWTELEKLLAGVLSPTGLEKMNSIRSLEREVAELEGGLIGLFFDRIRSAKRYFLAVFGESHAETAWGMRFDGHHLSLNWTDVPGEPLSVTPLFLGAQPRRVPDGLERAGLRVLADEEDRGLALLNGLTAAERAQSRIRYAKGSLTRRPTSIATKVPLVLEAPIGLARNAMDPASQKRLDAVIEVQLSNFVPAIADRYRARIDAQADSIRFAYASARSDDADAAARPFAAGEPLYYRVQGADFVMEYDNTTAEADHIHVIWRELDGDFGRDLLREHLTTAHAAERAS